MIPENVRSRLIRDIAKRAFTAKQLCVRYKIDIDELQTFVESNRKAIEYVNDQLRKAREEKLRKQAARLARLANLDNLLEPDAEGSTQTLADLWIANKYERIKRYQYVIEKLLADFSLDGMTVREIRSYLKDVAEELGHIPTRGSGADEDASSVNYRIDGVNLERLK